MAALDCKEQNNSRRIWGANWTQACLNELSKQEGQNQNFYFIEKFNTMGRSCKSEGSDGRPAICSKTCFGKGRTPLCRCKDVEMKYLIYIEKDAAVGTSLPKSGLSWTSRRKLGYHRYFAGFFERAYEVHPRPVDYYRCCLYCGRLSLSSQRYINRPFPIYQIKALIWLIEAVVASGWEMDSKPGDMDRLDAPLQSSWRLKERRYRGKTTSF